MAPDASHGRELRRGRLRELMEHGTEVVAGAELVPA
jgi:hypothetical protein